MLSNCSAREDSWESLRLQGDQTSQSKSKSTLNSHCKDWCWSWSSSTLATWCEELTHWKRPWYWGRLKRKRRGIQWMRWFNDITESTYRSLTKFQDIVKDREDWRTAIMGWQRPEHDFATEQQQYYHHNCSVFHKLPTLCISLLVFFIYFW